MYFATVRGETRRPSFSSSSFAMRSWPHTEFSRAIRRIRSRSSFGIGGRPARDFHRQKSRKPALCQPMSVSGRTTASALRQLKQRDNSANATRVGASTRLGFTPRSRYSASCRRRNKISASNDSRGRSMSPHHWIRSQARRTMMENALSTPGSCHSYRSWPAPRPRSNICGPQLPNPCRRRKIRDRPELGSIPPRSAPRAHRNCIACAL